MNAPRNTIDHCSEPHPANPAGRPAQPALEPTETIGTRSPRGHGARFAIAASYQLAGHFGRHVAPVQICAFGFDKFGFEPARIAAAWDARRGLVYFAGQHAPARVISLRVVRCRLRRLSSEGGRRPGG